ncbi:glutathione S-transferase family protein [Aliikangiella sp. IMCC44653]
MVTVYGDIISGNCYKVYLTSQLLNIPIRWKCIDILKGEAAADDFISKNPSGKIPILELASGEILSESNAIINYLAADSNLLPTDKLQLAKLQQWQFFEQYSHEPYIAVARFIKHYLKMPPSRQLEFEAKQAGGYKALKILEKQLAKTPFLIGEQFTTADISLYAYTHVADEGGFNLTPFTAIAHWIERIRKLPGYTGMRLKPEHQQPLTNLT